MSHIAPISQPLVQAQEAWLHRAYVGLLPLVNAAMAHVAKNGGPAPKVLMPENVTVDLREPDLDPIDILRGIVGGYDPWRGTAAFTTVKDGNIHFNPLALDCFNEDESMLAVMAHEMVHAAYNPTAPTEGHGEHFAHAVRAMGLEGPATSSIAGPWFKALTAPLAAALGPFPMSEA